MAKNNKTGFSMFYTRIKRGFDQSQRAQGAIYIIMTNSGELFSLKCDTYISTFCHVNDETTSLFFIRNITS